MIHLIQDTEYRWFFRWVLERKRRKELEKELAIVDVKLHFLEEEVEKLNAQVDELSAKERQRLMDRMATHPNHKPQKKKKRINRKQIKRHKKR